MFTTQVMLTDQQTQVLRSIAHRTGKTETDVIVEAVERLFLKTVHVEATLWAFVIMVISIVVDFTRSRALARVPSVITCPAIMRASSSTRASPASGSSPIGTRNMPRGPPTTSSGCGSNSG